MRFRCQIDDLDRVDRPIYTFVVLSPQARVRQLQIWVHELVRRATLPSTATAPLPFGPAAFVAATAPLPCVSAAFVANHHLFLLQPSLRQCLALWSSSGSTAVERRLHLVKRCPCLAFPRSSLLRQCLSLRPSGAVEIVQYVRRFPIDPCCPPFLPRLLFCFVDKRSFVGLVLTKSCCLRPQSNSAYASLFAYRAFDASTGRFTGAFHCLFSAFSLCFTACRSLTFLVFSLPAIHSRARRCRHLHHDRPNAAR